MTDPGRLLLLTPSIGFGGGIERVGHAIETAWPGQTDRVDLYRSQSVTDAAGQPAVKLGFAARALASALRARPAPSLVLATHVGLLPVAAAVTRVRGGRTALLAHGMEVWEPMSQSRRRLVARCDRLLAVSPYTAEWFSLRSGVPVAEIRILRNALPPTLMNAGAAEPAAEPRLITVSRLDPEHRYKGHFQVADAMALACGRGADLHWTVVGTGGDLPSLQAHVEGLGLSDRVRFETSLDDAGLAAAYRRAWLHVLPSVADPDALPPVGEGFGIVYAEAAAYGVPSIASASGGGALDFVEDGVTGRLCAGQDPVALADLLVELTHDGEQRRALGAAARERAMTRHDPRDYRERLLDALTAESPLTM